MKRMIAAGMLMLLCCFTAAAKKLVVAKDGSGDYTSIQQAINAASDETIIYIKNGIYSEEKLIVPVGKNHIKMVGESRDQTIISYHMYDCNSPESGNKCPAASWALWQDHADLIRTSATLTILGNDFTAENLTISNTAGPVGQAQALTLRGDRIIFRKCNILGYQDTVYAAADGMRSYFDQCLILGRTDYIYGGGIGYFQSCEIRSYGGGWITAPSTPGNQQYGFVFNNCKFTYAAASPRTGDDGRLIALGRPWHHYPKVAILHSELGAEIDPKGWPTTWRMPYAATSDSLHLYEYNNKGKGADMQERAGWAGVKSLTRKESVAYAKEEVLKGEDNWRP
ncbi:pectinesterase [Chitinophaga jiangningensis]|uniref:Pectinesterase n=1 Tax=Chitinophaga jiangningensis TaxID=1419482 RepID=A0A1M7JFL6_9BACT|nr:pectinesterase family protein [Chitinophaga jiangningensis]SHM51337.1 pectinesterase [Chitinophaga jiangningensis]